MILINCLENQDNIMGSYISRRSYREDEYKNQGLNYGIEALLNAKNSLI